MIIIKRVRKGIHTLNVNTGSNMGELEVNFGFKLVYLFVDVVAVSFEFENLSADDKPKGDWEGDCDGSKKTKN